MEIKICVQHFFATKKNKKDATLQFSHIFVSTNFMVSRAARHITTMRAQDREMFSEFYNKIHRAKSILNVATRLE